MSSLDDDGNEIEDGFRPRKKRTKAHMRQLLKDGIILDPDKPRPAEQHSPDAVVIEMETARLEGSGVGE